MNAKGLISSLVLISVGFGCAAMLPEHGSVARATAAEVSAGFDPSREIADKLCDVLDCPPCVVQIQYDIGGNRYQQGTGVLLDDGRILTAAHVVKAQFVIGNPSIRVLFGGRNGNATFDGASGRTVRVEMTDENADLAVIRNVEVPDFAKGRGAKLGKKAPAKGDQLTSVGLELPNAIRVHAAEVLGSDNFRPFLFIGVTAQQGDSGGPVFNKSGEVVGINSAIGGFTEVDEQRIQLPNGELRIWNSRQVPCTFIIDLTNSNLSGFLRE